MPKVELSDAIVKRIREMARETWDAIAPDVLGGRSWHRDEVISLVADADHMLFHGNDEEAYKHWKELPIKVRRNILREAFPYAFYGA